MSIYYKGTKQNGIKRDVHRVIMEKHIGRKLDRREVVHHINGNIHDNRLENLQLMTLAEHGRLHRTGRGLSADTRKKLSEAASRQDHWNQSKLTREQVAEAARGVESGKSLRSTAKEYGLSHSNLARSIKRLEKEDQPCLNPAQQEGTSATSTSTA